MRLQAAATEEHAGDPIGPRGQLVVDLVNTLLPAYRNLAEGRAESYVSLDEGLGLITRHAKGLGYDAVILFLDELILWLATHAADLKFLQTEGPKLVNLVEFKFPRPIPVVSFVARQRDLRELVGKDLSGAEALNFADILDYWEGRFGRINLEDRNLPAIAEKRLLRPRDAEARRRLDLAFQETIKVRTEVMDDPPDQRGDAGDVPPGVPVQPRPGADPGGRLQRPPAGADGTENHAPAPGGPAGHAAAGRPDPRSATSGTSSPRGASGSASR